MEPTSVLESLNAIGNVVGIPAALLVGWLFMRVKQISSEVEKLRTERDADRRDADSKLSEIYSKLNSLASDVSFIRGKLES